MFYEPRAAYNLTGRTFGRWSVVGFAGRCGEKAQGASLWKCRCQCGREKVVLYSSLVNGHSNSCGCLRGEVLAKKASKHKMSRTSEYTIYHGMIQRCENPARPEYPRYGGRGISVCPRWRNGEGEKTGFECFFEDMGPKPEGKSLDRWPNPDGNYEPGNCQWSTRGEQAVHKTGAGLDVKGNPNPRAVAVPTGERVRLERTYDHVDWTLSNRKIAQMMGVTPTAIANQRRRFAPGTKGVGAKTGPKPKEKPQKEPRTVIPRQLIHEKAAVREDVDFSKLDWTKTLTQLSTETGISYPILSKQKQLHEQKADPFHGIDWGRHSVEIIAEGLGLPKAEVIRAKKKALGQI
jgi:transposase